MTSLLLNTEFWKAVASLAWPIVALTIFFLLRDKIKNFFSRDNLTIKVAGMEISVADATKNIGTQVAEIQKKLAELEHKLGDGYALIANLETIKQKGKNRLQIQRMLLNRKLKIVCFRFFGSMTIQSTMHSLLNSFGVMELSSSLHFRREKE